MSTTSNYEGITVFPSESDCLAEAPDPYRTVMYYSHFLTLPLYTLSIYVLIFETPNSIRAYRKYLLWHTVGNLIFEVYISIFMLPVVYLPYLVIRGAGVLGFFNVSGLVQFYLLVTALVHTAVSVMEMFKYRFNAAICEHTLNKKILHKVVIFFWVIGISIPVIGFTTFPLSIPYQKTFKQILWRNSPGISIEVLCHTTIASPPLLDVIMAPLLVLINTTILTALIIVPHITITILRELEQSSNRMSKKTIEMQRMLVISLFIQAAIHGIMLGGPIVHFVYAVFFPLANNNVSYIFVILISFHGSISTVAMIGFTKPIRKGVFLIIERLIRPNKKATVVSISGSEFNLEPRRTVFQYRKMTSVKKIQLDIYKIPTQSVVLTPDVYFKQFYNKYTKNISHPNQPHLSNSTHKRYLIAIPPRK